MFASKRVHGEWFELASDEELNAAIADARRLAEEAGVASKLFAKALKLDKLESNPEKRPKKDADIEIATRFKLASLVLAEVMELRELVFSQFSSAKESGVDVSDKFSEKTVSLKPIFKTEAFLAKYPKLFQEFADSALLRLEGYWKWEKDIARAELQIATGRFAGIEGISSWNRAWKTTTKDVLDESALLKAHPKIYADFIEERVQQKRRSISKSKVG
jgi:hypothetical protein